MAQFVHHDLRLLNPSFSSPLLDVLTDLEYLRRLRLQGTTPWPVFLQLKQVFRLLESLASARIEGNHTTLADYVEAKVADGSPHGEPLREIDNIEQAMRQVDCRPTRRRSPATWPNWWPSSTGRTRPSTT